MVTIYQIEQRHRLLAQRMDDVMIVHDMAVLATPLRWLGIPDVAAKGIDAVQKNPGLSSC